MMANRAFSDLQTIRDLLIGVAQGFGLKNRSSGWAKVLVQGIQEFSDLNDLDLPVFRVIDRGVVDRNLFTVVVPAPKYVASRQFLQDK